MRIPATLEKRLLTLEQVEEQRRTPLERLTAAELFGAFRLTPDPWQVAMLESQAPRILLNIHRQGGKSHTAALLALSVALYDAALVLVVSPSLRQSRELFRRVLVAYRALGRPVPAHVENKLELELAHGGRVIALPGDSATVRGYSGVGLLVLEEASRIADDLYYTCRPMISVSNGRIVMLSTPHGKRGFYYDAWKERAAWDYYQVKAEQCSRISAAFLAEERKTMSRWFYVQEYEAEFSDSETQLFSTDDIERMKHPDVQLWNLRTGQQPVAPAQRPPDDSDSDDKMARLQAEIAQLKSLQWALR